MKYVANYIRKSRAESDEDLEKHRAVLVDLCNRRGYTYTEYAEVGTSDSIDMRPKMLELLRDVEDEIFDAVCIVDYDRLSRGDLGEQDRIKKTFQKSNTLIITPDMELDLNNDDHDTMADFKGFFARQEYKMIKKRLRQGKRIGARRGDWTNGTPPYPYEYQRYLEKYNPKGLVVNEVKLKTYRYIIEAILAGTTNAAIAQELNNQHIPSARGGLWHGAQIHRLALDETHLGKVISNKSFGDGHRHKKPNAKSAQMLPREEWIVVENRHEAVKTVEEHERIKELLNTRQKIPYRAREGVYALSGLVKCGKCGHTHSFLVKEDGLELMKPCWYKDPYGNKCDNKGVKLSVIEELVLEEIEKYKNQFLIENNAAEEKLRERLLLELEDKERQLERAQKALERINESYELGDYTRAEWLSRRDKWTGEIAKTKGELTDLNRQIKAMTLATSMDRLDRINAFWEQIATASSPKERNELYRTIIEKIIWTRNGNDASIDIEYK